MKIVPAFLFLLIGLGAQAGIDPEPTPPPLESLGDPEPSWFLAKGTLGPAYLFDSEHQRCPSAFGCGIHRNRKLFEQKIHDLKVPVFGSNMQRGKAVASS